MQFKILLSVLLIASSVRASSGAGQEAPEAQKESEDISGHQTQEWSVLQKEMAEKKAKIDQQQKLVEELLVKSKSETSPMTAEQAKELRAAHKKLTEMTADYNELHSRFEMRFPEKGQTTGRKYYRIDNLTLEQMENRMTIEGREKRLIKKIRNQYGKPESEDVTKKAFDPKKDKKPEVTDEIILVK